MADMEKVMTALELCSKSCDDDGCIYLAESCDKGGLSVCRCVDLLTRDAIELLKEQEKELAKFREEVARLSAENAALKYRAEGKPIMTAAGWRCGYCNHLIAKGNDTLPEKCDVCGTKVGSLL